MPEMIIQVYPVFSLFYAHKCAHCSSLALCSAVAPQQLAVAVGTNIAYGYILVFYACGYEDLSVGFKQIYHIFSIFFRENKTTAVKVRECIEIICTGVINLVTAHGNRRSDCGYYIGRVCAIKLGHLVYNLFPYSADRSPPASVSKTDCLLLCIDKK